MKTIVTAALVSLALAGTAHATTVVAFTSVHGTSVAADETAAGVTGFDLMRGKGLKKKSGSTYNSKKWTVGGNKHKALAHSDALFWGFSSTVGYDLTSVSFGYDRSLTGPSSIALDLFINGVGQGEIFADYSVAKDSSATATVDLTAFDDVTSAFFRLSGWNAILSIGSFDIENRAALGGKGIVVTGELPPAAVPLPAGLPLLAGALGLFGLLRRRG